MAIISSTTILTTLSILHLTTSYTLLASPLTILNQSFIFTLGTALHLPSLTAAALHSSSVTHPLTTPGNPALGLASIFLAFLALSDLTALSMREDVYNAFWTAQAPVRLGVLFLIESWIYFNKPGVGGVVEGWRRGIMTDLVFSWAFVEMLATFWVFLVLRDERVEAARKKREEGKGKGKVGE